MSRKSWIQTKSGVAFDPFEPDPMSILIEDIAHALSNLCRFTGHTREFYSVAEHSVRASYAAETMIRLSSYLGKEPQVLPPPDAPAWFMGRVLLLHDASEAYVVDVPAPIKPHLGGYAELEAGVMRAVAQKFCINETFFAHPFVKHIDLTMLATEKRDLLGPPPKPWSVELPAPLEETIIPWSPKRAREEFLARFDQLRR